MNRDLKSGRTRLHDPLYCMTMLAHPGSFIKILKEEVDNFEDGLFQRFLFCCPMPLENLSSSEKRTAPAPDISVVNILYMIEEICKNPIDFRFEDDAFIIYDKITDSYAEIKKKARIMDNFIGYRFVLITIITMRFD